VRLLQRHPIVRLVGNVWQLMPATQTVDALRIPTLTGSGAEAEPILRGGNLSVSESAAHLPNHLDRIRLRGLSMLPRAALTHPQL
jgi:hypothetical protein